MLRKLNWSLIQIPSRSDVYAVFNIESIQTTCLHTLNTLLMMVSTKFANRLTAMPLISGMINSVISDTAPMLQLALRNFINEKRLIENLH